MYTNPYQNRGPLDPINWENYGQIYSQPTSVSAGAQNAGNLFTGLGGNQLAQLLGQIGQNTTPTKIDTDLFALSPQTKKRNLALASIPASLGLIAASAPSTDPGAFAKGLGAAGQNLFTNVNALNNQAIQRNMLKYNMLRQAAADKRAAQLHPLSMLNKLATTKSMIDRNKLMDKRLTQVKSPMSQKEFEYYQKLSPEDKKTFMRVKRANKVIDFGGEVGVLDPMNPDKVQRMPKTLPPAQQPQNIAKAERARIESKEETEAELGLPQIMDQSNMLVKQIDDMLAHPGLSTVVGAKGPTGIITATGVDRFLGVPTDARDFLARYDQIKGSQFMEAFKTLKGGGQITETEGDKATQAISRMNTTQSEEEFINAANEFKEIVLRGLERAKTKAGYYDKVKPNLSPEKVIDWNKIKIRKRN